MLGVPLYPWKDKTSIKKVFYFWPSEIAPSMCGQFCLDGLYWRCTLDAVSEGQKWKCSLSSHGHRGSKNARPTLFHFARVRMPTSHLCILGSKCLEEAEISTSIIQTKKTLPSYDTVIHQNKDQSKEKLWWSYDDFVIYM